MNKIDRYKILVRHIVNSGYASSQKDLGRKIGYSNESSFSQIINEKVACPKDFVKKLKTVVPDLNIQWLLRGEGDMLLSNTIAEQAAPDAGDYRLVPLYNLDARGGFGSNVEIGGECMLDKIPFKGAMSDDICVPVSGDSMSPTYRAGAIVLLHRVEDWYDFVEFGQVYVIELRDGRRLIKELRKSETNTSDNYLCISHNPTFDPVELPKKLITRVYLVKAVYAKTVM